MSTLLSSLQTASTALQVFGEALGTDQRNVANASTPGYAAEKVTIRGINLSGEGGRGSDFIALSSSGDSRADATVQAAGSQAAESQTRAQQLSPVNQLFDISGSTGLLAALRQFSAAFSGVSVSPNDTALRSTALAATGNIASAFQTIAQSLDGQRTQLDAGIQSTTSEINALAEQIRQLNVQASGDSQINPATDAGLRSSLDRLSSLVDISVTKSANGSVSVLAGGQLPLVIGDQAYSLSVDPAGAPGSQVSSSAGGNSPTTFSGQLGSLLQTRTNTIDQLLGSNQNPGTLNTLASGFASRVNSLLSSGVTSGGAPGVPVFSFDAVNPANAARTLTLNSSVTADQLGLATTGVSAQVNGVANQLAALPGSANAVDKITGLSAEDLFGSIAASIGQQLSDARNASATDQTALTSAQTNRQQESGVSLDQEATNITAYERAYQANAQVITILNQLTGVAINLISGGSAA